MNDLEWIPQRYQATNIRAQGGMGDVSFYYDEVLEREVAIKTMLDISDMPRLQDEIDALLSLRSKYVVQVFDLIKSQDDNAAIIMERIQGNELSEFRVDNAENNEKYLKTLWQVAAGLADIHSQGVVHRDIKPSNMMLDEEGIVKIIDFGLARYLDFNAATSGFRGTFNYAAPEQYTNELFEFTSAIDVYAFSVVALYLIDGTLPPELKERPPSLPKDNPYLLTWLASYESLCEILFEGLSHDPSDRPEIHEIKKVLEKLLLKDRHQATIVFGVKKKSKRINSENRTAGIKYDGVGAFKVSYSGYEFALTEYEGDIYVNNMKVSQERVLPESCVITIGAPDLGWKRAFITFDVSNPEVTL